MGTKNAEQTLLLIEDDDTTREVLTLLLEADGWQVAQAASGEAALAAIVDGLQPAVVLSDMNLPGVDGAELAARLRESLPMATVLGMSATVRGATPAGYDALLQKPFGAEQVCDRLRVLTSERQEHAQRSDPELPTLDGQTLSALQRQLGDRVGDLYTFALADADSRIARMRSALESGDAGTFRSEAHALKGSAGMVGAPQLAAAAAAAEQMQEMEKSPADALLAKLEVACAEIRLMLETLVPVHANDSRAL